MVIEGLVTQWGEKTRFDPLKSEMIDLVLQGLSEADIAKRLKIAQQTVSLWKHDPGVIADLTRRRAERTTDTIEQISALNAKAKAAIETVVDTSKNDSARLKAAEMILKISGVMMDSIRNNANVIILQSSPSDKVGRVLELMQAINKIFYTMSDAERTIVQERSKHISQDKKDPIPVSSDIKKEESSPVEVDIKKVQGSE